MQILVVRKKSRVPIMSYLHIVCYVDFDSHVT
jgi:hypothetical protein